MYIYMYVYREIGTDATIRCGLDGGADAGKTRADLDHGVSEEPGR